MIPVEVPDRHSFGETMRISAIPGALAFDALKLALKLDCRCKFHASTIAVGNGGMARDSSLNKLYYSLPRLPFRICQLCFNVQESTRSSPLLLPSSLELLRGVNEFALDDSHQPASAFPVPQFVLI